MSTHRKPDGAECGRVTIPGRCQTCDVWVGRESAEETQREREIEIKIVLRLNGKTVYNYRFVLYPEQVQSGEPVELAINYETKGGGV